MHKQNEISVIPYGCLQFWDARLELDRIKLPKCFFREDKRTDPATGQFTHFLRCLEPDGDGTGYVDMTSGERCVEDYSIDPVKSLEHWKDTWLPVPLLRRLNQYWPDGGERFAYGPSNWARCRIHRLDENTLALTLAFDTNVEEPPADNDHYFALSPKDVSSHNSFMLADHVRDNSWFLAASWVAQWLEGVYLASLPKKKNAPQEQEFVLKHLANYLAMLQIIKAAYPGLVVSVINPANESPVEVDLILDIGNSRSTGILVETHAQSVTNLNNSYLLQLRDLSRPECIYSEPFETRVEFAEAKFGDQRLSQASGRVTSAFAWPSVVRVGPEAARLPTEYSAAQGTTGMSSPKRYLWDERPWQQTWRFNTPGDPHVTRGLFPQQVNDEGTPLACFNDPAVRLTRSMKQQGQFPAFESRFTRSSLMMFMVGELICQALVTINSPSVRKNRESSNVPRRLRRIIFTVPTAMPVAEQAIFRRWVNWAVRVVWNCLGWAEFYAPVGQCDDYRKSPQVRCDWDEASCTQLVYLYNELTIKQHGDAHLLFSLLGKKRSAYQGKPCIRMASIDIGGGTIDLSISTYELASASTETTHIVPHLEFRDGFNLAGDEVLRSLIDKHFSKLLADTLTQAGIKRPDPVLSQLMGRDYVGTTTEARKLRTRFVRQIAIPVALGMLDVCETLYQRTAEHKSFTLENDRQSLRLREFFREPGEYSAPPPPLDDDGRILPKRGPRPQDSLVAAINAMVNEMLPDEQKTPFDIMDMEVSFYPGSVNECIRGTLGANLATLCEVVHLCDCDLLLLTGRPSAWRGVVAPVLAKLPVPADRMVPMRQYHVGSWYPFADVQGRIVDPKTTVIVGAILCALAEGHLEGFSVDVGNMQLTSTAHYIGELTPEGKLIRDKVWFIEDPDNPGEVEKSREIKFGGPLTIGYRQLEAERWPTTRFHLLTFSDEQARTHSTGRLPYTVNLTFERQEKDEERNDDRDEGIFTIESITDRQGNDVNARDLTVSLQTLELAEGYWLDTGIVMG